MAGSKPAALPLGYTPVVFGISGHQLITSKKMAGVAGLEPTNGGIKTRCLTTWLYPSRNISMVRKERLELSRREALEPKSSVSTNSTTSAILVAKAGLEPATPSLWVMCSNQLSYLAIILKSAKSPRNKHPCDGFNWFFKDYWLLALSGAYYAYLIWGRQPFFIWFVLIA